MHRVTWVCALVLAAAAMVRGGEHAWMLFPGEAGQTHLAFLGGLVPDPLGRAANLLAEDVAFYLYTKDNPHTPVQIRVGDLNGAQFDPKLSTQVIVHGYASSSHAEWIGRMKKDLLKHAACQVLVVDWSRLAQAPLYNQATQSAVGAGRHLAQLIAFLVADHAAQTGRMHLIGHSLGAHLAGFAGKRLASLIDDKVLRITALDPSLPMFENVKAMDSRLHQDDAFFVDVIHTCSGWLGIGEPLGHADFYPNGGESAQPGCAADYSGCCSHSRAIEFFIESIASREFRAVQCDSYSDFINLRCENNPHVAMGFQVSHSAQGQYFLVTGEGTPFALG